jgi:hypothetical protein
VTPLPAGTRWEPDLAECVEETWRFDIGPGSHAVVSMWYDGPRLVRFAIMHWTLADDGSMMEIARADSCDGEVHVHTFDRLGNQVNRVRLLHVTGPEDVDRGYGLAYSRIIDRWEADRRRWVRGQ